MARRSDPKDDEWKYVQDARKRKQIQDRLAQRARRQRLRLARLEVEASIAQHAPNQDSTHCSSSSSPENLSQVIPDNFAVQTTTSPRLLLPPAYTAIDPSLDDLTAPSASMLEDSLQTTSLTPYLLSPISQPPPPQTVFSALYRNGQILSILCGTSYSSRSPLPKQHVPLPLHPTELQQMVVHPRWIDWLPFPQMRDNLIRLRGVVDEEELLQDLFCMPGWRMREGMACWDPRAWVVEREWKVKWGWLMF